MKCLDYSEAIAEFVDGALDLAQQRELERHVEGCAACRSLVADLKTIQAAAFTLDRRELPAHLLPALKARLANEPLPAARGRLLAFPTSRAALVAWIAAAAALLVITTAGIWSVIQSPVRPAIDQAQADAVDPTVESLQAELLAAAKHTENVIQQLEQLAKSDNGTLDQQIVAVIQKGMQEIDQSIDEKRAALQSEPGSADLQEGLFDALRSKVALLQQTVELINEMRKGNQAEAGRLIRGLNQ
jgi:anti-sigma factor RsiW